MISQIIISLLGWGAMILIGINLIGMFIRGLVMVADVENQISQMDEKLKKVTSEFYNPKVERKVNWLSLFLVIVYLGILLYFWNVWLVLAAILIMIARIPDLLWEIKNGRENVRNMPKVYSLTILIYLVALPIIWYSLYGI